MISSSYVRTMAAYNAEMNRRLYAAAGRLTDAERRTDQGAFWGSIHATLCHLLWADQMWMSRFDGWDKPGKPLAESGSFIDNFDALAEARKTADEKIETWAKDLSEEWMEGDLSWYSGAAKRDMKADRASLLVHLFNHQTHHRGQVHALLTRAGEKTGDTDIWLVVRK